MKNPIYEPKGAAREYGELALNIYTGCPMRCPYCFAPQVLHMNRETFHTHIEPRPGIVDAVREQLERTGMTGKTVHLYFTCDPFPYRYDCTPTLDIIRLLKGHGNHVQILTKSDGTPCLDLLDENDWYGVSFDGTGGMIQFWDVSDARKRGIKTWASFEPVLNPDMVLDVLKWKSGLLDKVKIGKLNYRRPPRPIDWGAFPKLWDSLRKPADIGKYGWDANPWVWGISFERTETNGG